MEINDVVERARRHRALDVVDTGTGYAIQTALTYPNGSPITVYLGRAGDDVTLSDHGRLSYFLWTHGAGDSIDIHETIGAWADQRHGIDAAEGTLCTVVEASNAIGERVLEMQQVMAELAAKYAQPRETTDDE